MKPLQNVEVPSFTVESHGSTFTYASPKSGEASMDFLAHTIGGKDPSKSRIILICQQNSESERLKSELAIRNVNTIRLSADDPMAHQLLLLWSKGYIQQALILCDGMLKFLEGIEVHFVIHATLPPLEKFEERLAMLSKSEIKTEMLVITGHNEMYNTNSGNDINNFGPENAINVVVNQPKLENKALTSQNMLFEDIKPLVSAEPTHLRLLHLKKRVSSTDPKGLETPVKVSDLQKTEKASKPSFGIADIRGALKDLRELVETIPTPLDSIELEDKEQHWSSIGSANSGSSSSAIDQSMTDTDPDESTSLESHGSGEDPPLARASSPAAGVRHHFGVLACSRHLLCPCYSMSGVPDMSMAVCQAMHKLGLLDERARGVQRFAWPHVASGKSLMVVGNMQTGKTWCYLPTLCQRSHADLQRRPADDQGFGPTSIVVCASAAQGSKIEHWVRQLLGSLASETDVEGLEGVEGVVALWEKGSVTEIACRLCQPVGILVTSADLLLQLLTQHHSKRAPIFDARALKYLALDNLHDMVRLLPVITIKLLKRLPQLFDFGQGRCQLVVSGRNWHGGQVMDRLLPLMTDVLILFEDPLEASVSRGLRLDAQLVQASQKCAHLVGLIRGTNLAEQRVIVVCSDRAEVLELQHKLGQMNVEALSCCLAAEGLSQVARWRGQSRTSLLLVTDDVVPKLKCGPIDLLVHYSWASSWMRFKQRFTLFYENYKATQSAQLGHRSVVLVQETGDVDSIWLLADFMLKHLLPRPSHLLDILAHRRLADQSNAQAPRLCRQLTAFGDCLRHRCSYRHVLGPQELLPPDHYPGESKIRFTVTACNSPANLAVRLSDRFPTTTYFLGFPMSQLSEQVQRHYEVDANRVIHPNPMPGEKAVVRNLNRYERVLILDVEKEKNDKVVARLLDSSVEILTFKASQLYICEETFKDQPGEAMEVRILGLEPANLERIWGEDERQLVRSQFFSRTSNKRGRLFTAHVQFAIHETIFVDNVYDNEGNDLLGFIKGRFNFYQENRCLGKLKKIVQVTRSCLNSN
ncbi:putative ATP-dependent RNA helicase SoYb [Drosophila elegans]|uniref:putative ATP-dependent RNA helicase SoYb n=1 Tax=Drosophila elegans TaxID=30023 RepID=UPI0007E622E7|nr:putative ATP-dependent RNA helicase SoYb [Drosophila elegans]